MKILLQLFSYIILSTQFAMAQQANISGAIKTSNNEPIVNASVYLVTEPNRGIIKSTLTNDKGQYKFLGNPKGAFRIEVTAVGFAKGQSNAFQIKEQAVCVEDIILEVQTKELETVTVAARLPLIQSKNGKLIMNVENSSLSAGNNALEVLQRAPGVFVDKDENISLMGQQGVNVMIDGRQTYMSGEQLATFLKSTDGNQIKSIEVSSTRSAKNDAEGAAGVINIVMKKNRLEGFNGTFLASAGHGKKLRANSSLNLNYKRDNTTLFMNYSYADNSRSRDLGLERIIPSIDGNTFFDQVADFDGREKVHNYKLGLEQKTSQRNIIMFQFSGSNSAEVDDNFSKTLMGPSFTVVDSIMNSKTLGDESFNRYSFNVNNEFKINENGKKLTADMDYSLFSTNANTLYNYHTLRPDLTYMYDPEHERGVSDVRINIFAAKLDYTQPIWKGNLETGLKYSNVTSDNAIQFDTLFNTNWMSDSRRSNTFNYKEQIAATYIDYAMQISKLGVKAGLRAEHTMSDGISETENKQVKRDYLDLFPSLSLSYNLSENHVFSANYAKKVTRPNYQYLNPFEYYIDKRTFNRGNPYLNPQYTHGISLNYTLYKMFNISVGHDMTKGAIVESVGQDSVLKTTWITRENLGKQRTSYLNLSVPVRVGKVWSMYNNLTGVYFHFKGPVAGHYVDRGTAFVQGNSINNFKISNQLSAELAFRLASKFIYNVYEVQGRFNTDIGATYNFKNQRSSLKLAVTDVFHSNHNNVFLNFKEFNSKIYQYDDSQTVRLTFNYKFGNLKQSIRRKDDSSEEKNRAL